MEGNTIFCSKCGAENEEDSTFCKNCGAALHAPPIKKASKLWYLLPIFLSLIGGIIGYFAIRSRDKRMAKNVLYVGLGMFALIIILLLVIPTGPPITITITEPGMSSPPLIGEIVFCSEEPGHRDYIRQPNATYKQSETVHMYYEVQGIASKSTYGGYEIHVKEKCWEVYDPDGTLIMNILDMIEFHDEYPSPPGYVWVHHWYELPLDASIGEYCVEILGEDILGNKEYAWNGSFYVEQ